MEKGALGALGSAPSKEANEDEFIQELQGVLPRRKSRRPEGVSDTAVRLKILSLSFLEGAVSARLLQHHSKRSITLWEDFPCLKPVPGDFPADLHGADRCCPHSSKLSRSQSCPPAPR